MSDESPMRPRVVAQWRMTANGIAHPESGEALCLPSGEQVGLDAARLREDLERLAALGVSEVVLEGDANLISVAFEQRLVDRVVCRIAPCMACSPTAAVTAGLGAAHMDEALRLSDVTLTIEPGGDIRVEGTVAR